MQPPASPLERFGRVPARAAKVRKARVLQVLISIASYADKNGVAFPSMTTIARDTGIDKRDIPRLIHEAERVGLIRVERRFGMVNVYQVIYQAGVGPITDGGVGSATDGGVGSTTDSGDRSPTDSGVGSPTDLTDQLNKTRRTDREEGTRLKQHWEPDTEEIAFAEALGLDPQWTADKFRDYWLAKTGAKAIKHDWSAAWRYWCRQEAEYSQRLGSESPQTRTGYRLDAIGAVREYLAASPTWRQESAQEAPDQLVRLPAAVPPVAPHTCAAWDLADRLGDPGKVLHQRDPRG